MFKSGGQGAPSSSRSFDCYDCTHMYIQDYCFLQFISCVHQLNSLTEIVKHARGIKKKPNATRYIYFFLLFFCS